MRNFKIIFGLLVVASFGFTACENNVASGDSITAEAVLSNELDSISYAYGIMSGEGMFKQGIEINASNFSKGFTKSINGEEGAMNSTDAEALLRGYFEKKQKQEEIESISKAEGNKEIGMAFMAENAKRSEVKTTESGLQYEVLKSGSGKTPNESSKVKVHYTGTFINGDVFDSSVERGQPSSFGVTQVIKGWTEALLMMKEGDKWKVFIPSDIAYGDMGRSSIPPGSTLIFEMELIEVQ